MTRLACTGIVLAGGTSRRMGRDKAWIPLNGRALISRVLDRLSGVCEQIIIVGNNLEPYRSLTLAEGAPVRVTLSPDAWPGGGSLGGIYTGLLRAQHDSVIAVACDMPFLNPQLLAFMLNLSEAAEVVVPGNKQLPEAQDRRSALVTAKEIDLHPLHAVYSKRCLAPIRKRLEAGDLRLISFYPEVTVRVVTPEEIDRFDSQRLSLLNVNTPEQLARAEGIARQIDLKEQ